MSLRDSGKDSKACATASQKQCLFSTGRQHCLLRKQWHTRVAVSPNITQLHLGAAILAGIGGSSQAGQAESDQEGAAGAVILCKKSAASPVGIGSALACCNRLRHAGMSKGVQSSAFVDVRFKHRLPDGTLDSLGIPAAPLAPPKRFDHHPAMGGEGGPSAEALVDRGPGLNRSRPFQPHPYSLPGAHHWMRSPVPPPDNRPANGHHERQGTNS